MTSTAPPSVFLGPLRNRIDKCRALVTCLANDDGTVWRDVHWSWGRGDMWSVHNAEEIIHYDEMRRPTWQERDFEPVVWEWNDLVGVAEYSSDWISMNVHNPSGGLHRVVFRDMHSSHSAYYVTDQIFDPAYPTLPVAMIEHGGNAETNPWSTRPFTYSCPWGALDYDPTM